MFQIDQKSRKAIYEQVAENFKRLITTGVLRENEKVPSVRDLASALDINPNTVQKAYRELETHGYIYTVLGQGSFIATPPAEVSENEKQARFAAIREAVHELMYYGVKKGDIIAFINNECGQDAAAGPREGESHDTD